MHWRDERKWEKDYLFVGDTSCHYMYCCCPSPAVKIMAPIKSLHHVADRKYIFFRTGDHDCRCFVKLRLRSPSESPCRESVCVWVDAQTSKLGLELQNTFFTHVSLYSYFPTPHLHHLTLMLGDIFGIPTAFMQKRHDPFLYARSSFRVLFYQLLHSATNLTCINIRVYSFSACSRKPFRSTACFPASCSPHCFVFILLCFIHVSYLSSPPVTHS